MKKTTQNSNWSTVQGINAVGHSVCTVICQSSYLQHFFQRDRGRARHDWMMSPLLGGNAKPMFASVPLGRSFTGVSLRFTDRTRLGELQSQCCRRETYCRDVSRAAEQWTKVTSTCTQLHWASERTAHRTGRDLTMA